MSDMQKKQNFLQGTALLAMATAIVKVIGALYKIPLNAIIGEKIASVSPKPQTTRTRITGIKTVGETQMVFMDTPGLHKPTTKLSGHMLKAVKDAVADIDAVLFVQDCTKPLSEQEEELLHSLEKAKTPTILVLNKIDLCSDKTRLMGTIARLNAVHSFAATIPVSVTESDGIDLVEQEVMALAQPAPHYFPDEKFTDQPERVLAAEMIREKILNLIRERRPRFVPAFELMRVQGNTISLSVPTSELREEILRSKTGMLMRIAELAGITGAIELEVVVNEEIRAARPIKLEDRVKYMTEKNPLIAELRKALDLEVE